MNIFECISFKMRYTPRALRGPDYPEWLKYDVTQKQQINQQYEITFTEESSDGYADDCNSRNQYSEG